MANPKDLLALALKDREHAKKLRAQADLLERQAGELEAMAERRVDTGSTERIIRTMDVNTHRSPVHVKRGAARATRNNPAQKRLYEKGKTITDIAADLKEGRPRVSSWFAEGEAQRPIPRRHAEFLRDTYDIPLKWFRVAD